MFIAYLEFTILVNYVCVKNWMNNKYKYKILGLVMDIFMIGKFI